MGEAGPTAFAVVEKVNAEAEVRWSAADSACALAIGTDGLRRRRCRRYWFMGGRRIEQRVHRRPLPRFSRGAVSGRRCDANPLALAERGVSGWAGRGRPVSVQG